MSYPSAYDGSLVQMQTCPVRAVYRSGEESGRLL
jgi:hypothetical protein